MPLQHEFLDYPLFVKFKEDAVPYAKYVDLQHVQAVDEPEAAFELYSEEIERVNVLFHFASLPLHYYDILAFIEVQLQ